MRPSVQWTPELDGTIRTLRQARVTWHLIAQQMSLGRNTVLERGRKIGALRGRLPRLNAQAEADAPRDRPAYPSGHHATWPVINTGLSNDRAAYEAPSSYCSPVRACCWPEGDPRTLTYRMCEGVPVRGKPYCAKHQRVAYKTVSAGVADDALAALDVAA